MRGCNKLTFIISPIDIKWFYKISQTGLCINRNDLHKIIGDSDIPRDVKKEIKGFFASLVILYSIFLSKIGVTDKD